MHVYRAYIIAAGYREIYTDYGYLFFGARYRERERVSLIIHRDRDTSNATISYFSRLGARI